MSSDDERGIRMPVFRPAEPPAHPRPSQRSGEPNSGTSRQSVVQHGSNEYAAALEAKIARQAQELGDLLAQLEASTQYATLCERRVKELAPAHPLPVQADHLSSGPPPTTKESFTTSSSRDGNPLAAPCCVAPPRALSGVPAYAVAKDAAWRRVERECAEQIFALKGNVRELDTKNAALAQQLKRTSQERDHRAREAGVAQRMACHLQHQLDDLQQRLNEGGNIYGIASSTANKNLTRDGFSNSDLPHGAKTAATDPKEARKVHSQADEASLQQASAEVAALRARVTALEAALELKAADLLELDTLPKESEDVKALNRSQEAGDPISTTRKNGQTLEELAAGALGETEGASPPPSPLSPLPPGRRRAAALLLDHAKLRGESAALTAALAEARAELAACKQARADLEARNADLSKELSSDRARLQHLRTAAKAVAAGPRDAATALAEAQSEAKQLEAEKHALLDYVQVCKVCFACFERSTLFGGLGKVAC